MKTLVVDEGARQKALVLLRLLVCLALSYLSVPHPRLRFPPGGTSSLFERCKVIERRYPWDTYVV